MLTEKDWRLCFVCDCPLTNSGPDGSFGRNWRDRIRVNSTGSAKMVFLCLDCLDAHYKREREAGRTLFPLISDRIRTKDPWFDPTPEQIAKGEEWRKKREEQIARKKNDSHRVSGDFLIDVFRNGTPTVTVRVTHVPTGLVLSGEGLSVYGVRETLLKELREKLAEKKD